MKKILAFEADHALAQQLAHQLAPYGCTMDVVDDGNVGLQKARTTQPDLILLTIELPKMNGFSICNKLKKNPDLKDIPLVIMSSEATEDTFQQHRKLRTHAEEYIKKPFNFQELIDKIGSYIDLDGPSGEVDAIPAEEAEIAIDTSGLEMMEEGAETSGPFSGEDDLDAATESAFAALQGDDPVADLPAFEGFEADEHTVAGESPFQFEDPDVNAVQNLAENPPPVPTVQGAATPPPVPPAAPPLPPSGPTEEETRLQQENEDLRSSQAALEGSARREAGGRGRER